MKTFTILTESAIEVSVKGDKIEAPSGTNIVLICLNDDTIVAVVPEKCVVYLDD